MTELRRAIPFLAFALALFVTGCTLLPAPFQPSTPAPQASDPRLAPPDGDTTQIDAAAAAWDAAGIDDYQLDLGFLCACALAGNVVIDVVDGVPTLRSINGKPANEELPAMFPLTVDGLLGEARRVIEQGGTVQATFDPATGAPTRLEVDYMPQAIDDELTIVINGLTPAS